MKQKNAKKERTSTPMSAGNPCQQQKKIVINSTLLILVLILSISGIVIQIHYHLLKNGSESIVWILNRTQWNTVHVWTSIGFLGATLYHVWVHRNWYKNALKQIRHPQKRPTLILTLFTLLVVLSGLTPLLMSFFEINSSTRFSITEIHDKISILFLIVAFRHIFKRFKWYVNAMKSK